MLLNDPQNGGAVGALRVTLAGLCASLVGIGIGRFAYTPLIPALIAAKWFSPSDVVYLGAANLVGYLIGALAAQPAAARFKSTTLLRAAMLLASAACLACATPVSMPWFFAWRFVAGLSGGIIMVLVAATVLPHTPPSRRGLVGGAIFSGIGLGVAASGTLVPLLLRYGLVETWYGMGALSLALTAISWMNWPPVDSPRPPPIDGRGTEQRRRQPLAMNALILEYGLNAVALVPHMVFLVDFVARGLAQGLSTGSHYWVVYGLGAVVGPLLAGRLADHTGFGPALRLAFLIQALAISIPLVTTSPAGLIVSSAIVGAFTPGIAPLAIGRVHELIPDSAHEQRAAWSRVTVSFALFQALSAYGFSYLFARTEGDYILLFAIGAGAVMLSLALDLLIGSAARNPKPTPMR